MVNGEIWLDTAAFDVMTGRLLHPGPAILRGENTAEVNHATDFTCPIFSVANNIVLSNRLGRYQKVVDNRLELYYYRGMRAACGEAGAVASGMILTPPVNCVCLAPHPYGYCAIASVGSDPAGTEFTAARPVLKGPAFDALAAPCVWESEWPMFRANAERSCASPSPSAFRLKPLWEAAVAAADPGRPDDSRISTGYSPLSQPVLGDGIVVVAVTHTGEVVALDRRTGAETWRYRAGGRIITSPTMYKNGCYFGANDGYLYALNAKNGQPAWRVRLAPREIRIVDHGQFESPWTVFGSVLAFNDVLFAAAGRNSEADGGTVVFALDPATGRQLWVRHIDEVQMTESDILKIDNGELVWQNIRLDPDNGKGDLRLGRYDKETRSDMSDNTLMYHPANRRTGTVYKVDNQGGWLLAWNERFLIDAQGAATPRDTARKPAEVPSRGRSFFDITKQPVAMVACPSTVLLGYSALSEKGARITIRDYNTATVRDYPLAAGVTHNGIAAAGEGVVVSMDNGTVAFFRKEPVVTEKADFVLRINCAGREYMDSHGNTWQADRVFSDSASWGYVGGEGYDRVPDYKKLGDFRQRKPMESPDPYLYLTEMGYVGSYRIKVPNGQYEVTLHFAETYFGQDMVLPNGDIAWMRRRFDVLANGACILRDSDPLKEAGGRSHSPVVKRFAVEAGDGEIEIGFRKIEQNPFINAIEVRAVRQQS